MLVTMNVVLGCLMILCFVVADRPWPWKLGYALLAVGNFTLAYLHFTM